MLKTYFSFSPFFSCLQGSEMNVYFGGNTLAYTAGGRNFEMSANEFSSLGCKNQTTFFERPTLRLGIEDPLTFLFTTNFFSPVLFLFARIGKSCLLRRKHAVMRGRGNAKFASTGGTSHAYTV